jgi:hypothetical protein
MSLTMPHTTMEVTDKDDNTMNITNEGDTDTPSQDVPGADLTVALLPANSWTQHLNDPASTLVTISPPALHQIIGHGTTEYEKMVEAWRAEKVRADRLQAEKDEMIRKLQANKVETIGAAPLPFRSNGAARPRITTHPLRNAQADGYIDRSMPKPIYSDRCIQAG